MAAQHPKIRLNLNLLFPQGVPQKLPIRFLKWLTSYGRFIAIVVEAIVIVTFITRFKMDADLADLKDKINKQIPFIESLAQNEAEIKQTQFKLAQIKKVYSSTPDWGGVLSKISQQLPSGVKLSDINLDHSEANLNFRVTGVSSSNADLATFIGGLKQESSFRDINLTNVNFDSGQIDFAITGGVK